MKFSLVTITILVAVSLVFGYPGTVPNNYAGNPTSYNTCHNCHSSYALNSGNGSMFITGLPTAGYVASTTYHLVLHLEDPGQQRWGFQLTVEYLSGTSWLEGGTLIVTDPTHTQLSTVAGTAPDFLKHNSAGTYNGQANSASWNFDWTAPSLPANVPVTFYFSGAACNGTGGTGGDYVYTTSTTVQPGATAPTLDLTLSPVNPPIVIPATGGTFSYNIAIANTGTATATTTVWNMITLPTGSNYGPVFGPFTVTLAPGGNIARVRNQSIPAGAPAGTYNYRSYIGTYPTTVVDSASFTFTKSAVLDGGMMVNNWDCGGEAFPEENLMRVENPSSVELKGAYPNPFNPSTAISFELQDANFVDLVIYDIQGREVASLVTGQLSLGEHRFDWNAEGMPSGVYFARLQVGNTIQMQKLLLVK
jgi:hypothetical protein